MDKKIISRLYPTSKLMYVFVMVVLSIFFGWEFSYLFVLPLCLFLALIDGKIVSYVKKVVVSLALFVGFIFIFQVILDTSDTEVLVSLGPITITIGAIYSGLRQTRVLLTLVTTILLFFETTEMEELMFALQKMNVSHLVTYVILSTLQLIPDMISKSSEIMQAQQSRGIETEGSLMNRMKAFFPSLGPLIISSITDVENKAITLETRGFSSDNKKTSLKQLEKHQMDNFIIIGLVLFFVAMIVWRLTK